MLEELKEKGSWVNGFLDKAQPVTFGEDGITIHVNAGCQILESVGAALRANTGSHSGAQTAVCRYCVWPTAARRAPRRNFEQYLQESPAVRGSSKGDAARLRLRVWR